MEEKNNYSLIYFTILIVIVGLCYWFLLRPAQIRKECYDYAYGTPNNGNTVEWRTATNYYFEACMRRNGLNP